MTEQMRLTLYYNEHKSYLGLFTAPYILKVVKTYFEIKNIENETEANKCKNKFILKVEMDKILTPLYWQVEPLTMPNAKFVLIHRTAEHYYHILHAQRHIICLSQQELRQILTEEFYGYKVAMRGRWKNDPLLWFSWAIRDSWKFLK